ncbi:ThuA domain-containing protein [Asanoa sp. NPDC049573]|uniref:ThuA domain-containing protein n=1 Tax=Asanoa sp. NPDC049573 TaxID=3155396 RepID=UPI003431E84B
MTDKLKVALITEWHPFDVVNFQELFRAYDDIDAYPQAWDIFAQDVSRDSYDALVFYNMSFPAPPEDDPRRRYLEGRFGNTGQGIVLLHHAILSYETWPFWDAVSGTKDRRFTYHGEQELRCRVADNQHPITRGLDDFTVVDESYAMAEPAEDNEVLLTTDHPRSLRAIAWTRTYRDSRVFCYQSGHDDTTWRNPSFRTMLHRGIRWTAGRLH